MQSVLWSENPIKRVSRFKTSRPLTLFNSLLNQGWSGLWEEPGDGWTGNDKKAHHPLQSKGSLCLLLIKVSVQARNRIRVVNVLFTLQTSLWQDEGRMNNTLQSLPEDSHRRCFLRAARRRVLQIFRMSLKSFFCVCIWCGYFRVVASNQAGAMPQIRQTGDWW